MKKKKEMMVPDFDGGGVGYGGVDGYGVGAFSSFSSAQVAPPGQEPTIIVTEVEKVNYAENVKKEEENDGHDLMKVLCNKSNTYSAFASGDCGGDELTWGSSNDEAAAVDFVTIKEEEGGGAVDFVDDDGNMDRSELSSLSSTSTEALPKPMEGLYESGPPPFLKKIYDMVEDPETDPVVSWSANRSSFVVWETQYFSEKLLPKYFKHKNFSSFIRQLNTYGFRKINSDRWEFANEKFRRGKKHLLKAIKRRNRSNKPQGGAIACVGPRNHDLQNEIEAIKNDQNTLRFEILELNRKQEDSHNQMTSFEERIRCAECKQQQMLNFIVKIAKYPNFVQKLIQKRKKRQREINGIDELDKRPQLPSHQQQHFASMQSELPDMLLYRMDSDDDAVQEQFNEMCGNGNMISHGDGLNPEKNVGDSKELCVNDAQIFQDLEDLIGKPGGWAVGQLAD